MYLLAAPVLKAVLENINVRGYVFCSCSFMPTIINLIVDRSGFVCLSVKSIFIRSDPHHLAQSWLLHNSYPAFLTTIPVPKVVLPLTHENRPSSYPTIPPATFWTPTRDHAIQPATIALSKWGIFTFTSSAEGSKAAGGDDRELLMPMDEEKGACEEGNSLLNLRGDCYDVPWSDSCTKWRSLAMTIPHVLWNPMFVCLFLECVI
jgi:hypothetical protein